MPFLIPIGAAIGGALISKAGGNKAAKTQASAADEAARLQKQAADESLAFQKQQYEEQKQRMQPWVDTGTSALGKINVLQPFQAPGVDFTKDPGYEFRLAEGQKALERSAAARGNVLGGGALKAATRYGQDFGSNEYGNVYARRMAEYTQNYNQLSNQAGMGQTTSTGLGALGANLGSNVNSTLMNSAQGQGNALQNAAAARASGYVNSGNTWGNIISSSGNALADWLAMRRNGPQSTLQNMGAGN